MSVNDPVQLVLDEFKDDEILIDALNQWAMNPTSKSAGFGIEQNYPYIKRNIMARYSLSDSDADWYIQRLKDRCDWLIHIKGNMIYELRHQVEKKINYVWGERLRNRVLERISNSGEEIEIMVYLFGKLKCGHLSAISIADNLGDLNRINAIYLAATGKCLSFKSSSELLDSLVPIGVLNELLWIGSKSKAYASEYRVPLFVREILDNVDNYLKRPKKPNVEEYISFLFERHEYEQLRNIDMLLHMESYLFGKIRGLYCAYYRKYAYHPEVPIISSKGIIGKYKNCTAISPLVIDDLDKILQQEKERRLKPLRQKINDILESFRKTHWPSIEVVCEDQNLWMIHSLKEPLLSVFLTTWVKQKIFDSHLLLIVTNQSLPSIKNCIERGDLNAKSISALCISHGRSDFKVLKGDKHKFVDKIINNIAQKEATKLRKADEGMFETSRPVSIEQTSTTHTEITGGGLKVFLGYSADGKEIFWEPGSLFNGHFLIVGSSGAGKTETIRCIVSELARGGFPVLMVDFHGDMACEKCHITTYEIKENSSYYFNPLELDPRFPEITPLKATLDFTDAVWINYPSMGIQQRNRLKEIIKETYEQFGITNQKTTWSKEVPFDHIVDRIRNSEDKITQTLKGYISDISDFGLFSGSQRISMGNVLHGKVTHINLKPLPESLRSLYADLFLRKLYYSLQALGEIPRGDVSDKDKFRIFVIVDEAKLLVAARQEIKAVLNKYATEIRKYGGALILASQLITHFNDEILNNIAIKLLMKAENKKQARENSKFFDVNDAALLSLKRGEGILVTSHQNRIKKEKVKIIPTWERNA